jgi:selenium metabolism protein YedF
MKELDCRKQACPAPVLMTRQVIEAEAPDRLTVHVDNEAACQNVSRFFASKAYETTVENAEDGFRVTGTRSGQDDQASADVTDLPGPAQEAGQKPEKKIMVMITTDRMGYGDDVLGKKLMTNFVNTLNEMGPELWRLVLVNNGVRLAVTGSEVLSALQQLEKDGLAVLVCGTCLDHYGLLEHKQTGQTTNMLDIVTAMQLADQVINI